MKKTNNFFHKGVYLETLRYLKVVGIVALVIFGLAAILPPLGNYISRVSEPDMYFSVGNYTLEDGMECLQILYFIFVPVMTVMTFSFLNKRRKCDFYHAIPVKRGAIYFSMVSAVLTWCVIIIVSSSLLFFATVGILPNLCVKWDNTLPYMVSIFSGCLFVAGAITLGMSVTGTGFTNFIVTVMIICVPRIFIELCISAVETYAPLAVIDSSSFIFAGENNIVLTQFFSKLFWYESADTLRWGACAYTAIIGLIYIGAGAVAFIRRKSESASNPSVNSVLQTIFRLIPAYFVGLIPVIGIIECYKQDICTSVDIFTIISVYFVCILVYFLYELITTRRIRKTFASVKQLPFLVLLHVITLFGVIIVTNIIMGYHPAKDEITSAVIDENCNYAGYAIAENTVIEDETAIGILIDSYEKSVEYYKETNNIYEVKYEYGLEYEMVIEFREDGSTHKRRVFISKGDYIAFIDAVKKSDPKSSILPEYNNDLSLYVYNSKFTQEMCKTLYNSLYEELKGIGGISKATVDYEQTIAELYVTYVGNRNSDDRMYDYRVPISSLTPKTLELYEQYSKECGIVNFTELPALLSGYDNTMVEYKIIIETDDNKLVYYDYADWAYLTDINQILSHTNIKDYSTEKGDNPYTLYIIACAYLEKTSVTEEFNCFERYYITEEQLKEWM